MTKAEKKYLVASITDDLCHDLCNTLNVANDYEFHDTVYGYIREAFYAGFAAYEEETYAV